MQEIIINGRFLSQSVTGVQRVALEVVRALDNLIGAGIIDANSYSFTLAAEKDLKYKTDFKNISVKVVGHLTGHLWEQFELPLYARGKVLVSLCGPAPIIKRNQLALIHDAAPYTCPSEFSLAFRSWYQIMFFSLCKRARQLVTVSDFSRKELSHYCNVSEQRVTVAYPGIDHFTQLQSDISILERHGLINKRFVLAVSSLSPRKNFLRLIDAVEALGDPEVELVVAGGINSKVFNSNGLEVKDRITYLGRVSDMELKALYENAHCFAFPSLYEGFGLPPIEAMSCGCPVIAANAASLPEVCGDAALFCDPYDPRDIADKIQRFKQDTGLREQLKARGLERAASFTWDRCGRDIWSVIEKLLR
ncbi:MAG TPA: glycosyltransferase family 1 protein [Candidatus Aquicultor sp.]|jgi:glycosyltransferase involved in cell wall biosynthesis